MNEIQVLDNATINKIAAGEVVERPVSVVKELVENAIDAGATGITVEINDGGIEFIRVTDNGSGISKDQIKKAFLRHATSKITTVEDLNIIQSLGFRGEALSSIAAVSRVELITKTKENLTGIRFLMEGAVEKSTEEVGAPDGTTFLVRNLFFNTPVRRNFLKTPATEGSYVSDLMERIALSKPQIAFTFISSGKTKFHTSGNGDISEVIYRIYGREIGKEIIPLHATREGISLYGYLGKPMVTRSNRNYENYFVNSRYIRSDLIARAIEAGYGTYLMQHKYPFCVLHFVMDTKKVDVNVHPTKMDIRFSDPDEITNFITESINEVLNKKEMIPVVTLPEETLTESIISEVNLTEVFAETDPTEEIQEKEVENSTNIVKEEKVRPLDIEKLKLPKKVTVPEPFEQVRMEREQVRETSEYGVKPINLQDFMHITPETKVLGSHLMGQPAQNDNIHANIIKAKEHILVEKMAQIDLFEEKILSRSASKDYKILGQVFKTYWLVEYQDKLLYIDQHAAHEKVIYEQIIKKIKDKTIHSQMLQPPIIITVTGKEEAVLKEFQDELAELGFQVEEFGGNEYAIRSIPTDLFGFHAKELFLEFLDELCECGAKGTPMVVLEKLASMSCKAAVKGNHSMSMQEANELIEQLLELENPYHCPHGRPTIVSMTKYEMEKKFKRIL